ncbi:MAG TPA: phosphate-starvation-inducible PsiE family protein [Candidatus Brocadiaceae bacterium]
MGYKVIILDVKQLSSLTLLGIASVVIALSVGYYLLKQSHQSDPLEIKKSD